MPISCVVGGCKRNASKNPEVSFFRFPRNSPNIIKQWQRFVNNTRADFVLSKWSAICGAHFTDECKEVPSQLQISLGIKTRPKVKPGSIPSLKAPSKSETSEGSGRGDSRKLSTPAESASKTTRKRHSGTAFKKREKSRVLQEAFAEYESKHGQQPSTSTCSVGPESSSTSDEELQLEMDVKDADAPSSDEPAGATVTPSVHAQEVHFKDASGPTSEHPDPVPVQLGKVINNERQRGKRAISLQENLCDPGSVNVHNQQNIMPSKSESAVILQCVPGFTFQSNNNTKFSSLDVLATAAQIQEERSTQLGEKQQLATKKPPEDLKHPPSTVADLDCHYFEVDSVRTSSIKNLFEHYTGLTYAMFTVLFEFLVPDPTRNPVKCCYIYTLPLKQQLFMVLCRLRNGLHAKDLAFRMRASPQTVVTVFNCWIKVMHVRLSCLPWWQHRDTLLGVHTATHRQECGGNYLGIVGQAELRMEESSTRSHCYCDDDISIKTLKSLIVINSRGSLMFVSELFSGSMPDYKVCEDSDLIKLLSEHKATGMIQDGDGIVADERFQIKSQLDKLGLEVITPQDTISMNSGKVTKTTELAAHRVRMKLAIDRIKGFKLVSRTIPFNLVQQINEVWYVCSMLTNFQVALTQEL